MERRNVVGGGLAAGFAAMMTPAPAAAAQRDGDDALVAGAVNEVRAAIDRLHTGAWGRVNQVREQQRIWLRANHRYPDFIEIGITVWEALYDWHVRYQQPLNVQHTADGRYVMAFMFTTLILRPDQTADYVGPPFDNSSDRLPQPAR